MSNRKKKCPECPRIAKWMTTFTDLISLLMTFFILLLTMASMDPVKMDAAFGILSGGRGIFDTSSANDSMQTIVSKQAIQTPTKSHEQMMDALQGYVEAQNIGDRVSVVRTGKGFSIRIADSVLFEQGSASIRQSARPVLDVIVALAVQSNYYANIEGHTDDDPMSTRFGNWDLSTARALSVLKYMVFQGARPDRLSATSFGEYHPVLPNITEQNKSKNRRVEINFVTPEFFESDKNLWN